MFYLDNSVSLEQWCQRTTIKMYMPPHNQVIRNEEPIEAFKDITFVINISTPSLSKIEMSEKDEKCESQRLYDMVCWIVGLLNVIASPWSLIIDHTGEISERNRTEILISTKRSKTKNCNATNPWCRTLFYHSWIGFFIFNYLPMIRSDSNGQTNLLCLDSCKFFNMDNIWLMVCCCFFFFQFLLRLASSNIIRDNRFVYMLVKQIKWNGYAYVRQKKIFFS